MAASEVENGTASAGVGIRWKLALSKCHPSALESIERAGLGFLGCGGKTCLAIRVKNSQVVSAHP